MARELIWNIEDHPTFAEAQEKLNSLAVRLGELRQQENDLIEQSAHNRRHGINEAAEQLAATGYSPEAAAAVLDKPATIAGQLKSVREEIAVLEPAHKTAHTRLDDARSEAGRDIGKAHRKAYGQVADRVAKAVQELIDVVKAEREYVEQLDRGGVTHYAEAMAKHGLNRWPDTGEKWLQELDAKRAGA